MSTTPTPPPGSAATAELHRRFCSDVPNDGTYTLHLNETETIRFFAEADRLIAAHCAAATAKERQARELAEGENARLRAVFKRVLAPFDSMGNFGGSEYGHKAEVIRDARAALAPAPAGGKPE